VLTSPPMWLAAALALAPWSPVPAAQDERTLAVLEEARRVAEQAGEGVWPGFSLSAIPLALFSDDTALLVHHPAPPAGFEPLASSLSTPLWRGPRTAEMNANTSGSLAGAVTAFVSIASLGSGEIGAADVALLIHEAGHAFSDRAPGGGEPRWPSEDASLVASYPVDSPANNAWGRIEGAILRDALEAADRARALELARDFVAVRLRRQRGLDPALARFERDLELNEGLAEYFACKAIELAEPSGAPAPAARERGLDPREYGLAGDYLARLRDELGRINAGGRGAARQRFYATGAAQGLLLDRLGVDWKVAVEGGADLLDQLARAAGAGELDARLERIAAQRGFDDLARRERLAADAAAALRRKKLVDLLAEPGRKRPAERGSCAPSTRSTSSPSSPECTSTRACSCSASAGVKPASSGPSFKISSAASRSPRCQRSARSSSTGTPGPRASRAPACRLPAARRAGSRTANCSS